MANQGSTCIYKLGLANQMCRQLREASLRDHVEQEDGKRVCLNHEHIAHAKTL